MPLTIELYHDDCTYGVVIKVVASPSYTALRDILLYASRQVFLSLNIDFFISRMFKISPIHIAAICILMHVDASRHNIDTQLTTHEA